MCSKASTPLGLAMELETSAGNETLQLDSGSGANGTGGAAEEDYSSLVHLTETKILPVFIGFLCSTGRVGNILVLVTILRWV